MVTGIRHRAIDTTDSATRSTYNRPVAAAPLASDTTPEVERLQIDAWRRMSPVDKAATVTALTVAAMDMTRAGIRHRHPAESPAQHRIRLAEILFGTDLARRMFPDVTLP